MTPGAHHTAQPSNAFERLEHRAVHCRAEKESTQLAVHKPAMPVQVPNVVAWVPRTAQPMGTGR